MSDKMQKFAFLPHCTFAFIACQGFSLKPRSVNFRCLADDTFCVILSGVSFQKFSFPISPDHSFLRFSHSLLTITGEKTFSQSLSFRLSASHPGQFFFDFSFRRSQRILQTSFFPCDRLFTLKHFFSGQVYTIKTFFRITLFRVYVISS